LSKIKKTGTSLSKWGGGPVYLLGYTHFSHDLCTGLLVALLPLIREGLGLSYLQSGFLLSAFTVTSGLSQFLGGWVGDRMSRRLVIMIGVGGVGLSALAVGLNSAYYPILAVMVIMGIFAGAYHPSAVSLLSSSFDKVRRGKAMALHLVGGSIGFAIGPILGGIIADAFNWRFAFILLSLPALFAVPLILKKLSQPRRVNRSRLTEQIPVVAEVVAIEPIKRSPGIGHILRPIAIVLALVILVHFVSESALSFVPLYLVDKHNIDPAYAAMLLGVIRGGGIIGSLFGGWLSDRWSRRNSLLVSLIAIGPVLYLLTILPFNGWIFVIFILFGFLLYMRMVTIQPFLMENVPSHFRATAFGIYFGLSMEGISVLQPVAGHYMDIFGIADVFNIIALVCLALSVVALFMLRRKGRRQKQGAVA